MNAPPPPEPLWRLLWHNASLEVAVKGKDLFYMWWIDWRNSDETWWHQCVTKQRMQERMTAWGAWWVWRNISVDFCVDSVAWVQIWTFRPEIQTFRCDATYGRVRRQWAKWRWVTNVCPKPFSHRDCATSGPSSTQPLFIHAEQCHNVITPHGDESHSFVGVWCVTSLPARQAALFKQRNNMTTTTYSRCYWADDPLLTICEHFRLSFFFFDWAGDCC